MTKASNGRSDAANRLVARARALSLYKYAAIEAVKTAMKGVVDSAWGPKTAPKRVKKAENQVKKAENQVKKAENSPKTAKKCRKLTVFR